MKGEIKMNRPSLSKITRSVRTSLSKHSSEILTGVGIAGMVTTTVLAVRATPKAIQLIDEKKDEIECDELSKIEVIKTCWKCYIPAALTGTLSIGCLVGANSVNARRNTVLATAYKLSETALTEYQEKVIETIGEKKEQSIRDKIAKDHIDKDPVSNREIIITNNGDTLCYDVISGRYFKSDIEKIRRAENLLNKQLLDDMYVSLNEFYYEIGLNSTSIGDDLGWNIDKGLIELGFSTQLSDDGTPCLVVDYQVAPMYNYGR
jgi:hypothetical protein